MPYILLYATHTHTQSNLHLHYADTVSDRILNMPHCAWQLLLLEVKYWIRTHKSGLNDRWVIPKGVSSVAQHQHWLILYVGKGNSVEGRNACDMSSLSREKSKQVIQGKHFHTACSILRMRPLTCIRPCWRHLVGCVLVPHHVPPCHRDHLSESWWSPWDLRCHCL